MKLPIDYHEIACKSHNSKEFVNEDLGTDVNTYMIEGAVREGINETIDYICDEKLIDLLTKEQIKVLKMSLKEELIVDILIPNN